MSEYLICIPRHPSMLQAFAIAGVVMLMIFGIKYIWLWLQLFWYERHHMTEAELDDRARRI